MNITNSLRQTAAEFFANASMGFRDDQQRKAFFARITARRRMLKHNAETASPQPSPPATEPAPTPAAPPANLPPVPVSSSPPVPTPLPPSLGQPQMIAVGPNGTTVTAIPSLVRNTPSPGISDFQSWMLTPGQNTNVVPPNAGQSYYDARTVALYDQFRRTHPNDQNPPPARIAVHPEWKKPKTAAPAPISWQGPLGWSNASRINTIDGRGMLFEPTGGEYRMINGQLFKDGVAQTEGIARMFRPLANAGPRAMLQDEKQRRAFFARMHRGGGGGGGSGGGSSGPRKATPIDGGGMIAAPRQQVLRPGTPVQSAPTMPEHLRYAPGSQNGTVHPDHNTREYQQWFAERAAWERANYPITGGPVPIGGPISSLPQPTAKISQPAPPQRPVGGAPSWYLPPSKSPIANPIPTLRIPLGNDGLVVPRTPERPTTYPNYQSAIQQELAKRQSAQQEQVLAGLKKFTPIWYKTHSR